MGMFAQLTLRALLAPGNLPALRARHSRLYDLHRQERESLGRLIGHSSATTIGNESGCPWGTGD